MKKRWIMMAVLGSLCGMAIPAYANPVVYATTFPSGNATLETIDLTTGAETVLGTVGYGGTVNDIAVNPLNGMLYGLSGSTLFTINTTTSPGTITTLSSSGMNSSMETLAFNSAGDLYIGTQADLYRYNFSLDQALHIGSYGGGAYQLNGTGQNIRFAGSTLYVGNTDTDNNDTDLYTIDLNTGYANWFGTVDGHPGMALGNYGDVLYGCSVPAVGGFNAPYDLLLFGSSPTTTLGPDPDAPLNTIALVDHTAVVSGGFPNNVNFSQAIPEPATASLMALVAGVGFLIRRRFMA